jgi:anti-sigma B factor antagonist
MPLEYALETVAPDVTVVKLKGRIVLGRESQTVEALIRQLVREDRRKLVLDLSGVSYVDSSGVGSLAMCAAVAQREGRELLSAAATGAVQYVLRLTRMDQVLKLQPSVAEACETLRSGSSPGLTQGE